MGHDGLRRELIEVFETLTDVSTLAALDECAREPIHIPGAIQPHGGLIALTVPGFEVTHFSANVDAVLGLPAGSIAVGVDLRQLFSRSLIHDLGNTLQAAAIARVPERLLGVSVIDGATRVDIVPTRRQTARSANFCPQLSKAAASTPPRSFAR